MTTLTLLQTLKELLELEHGCGRSLTLVNNCAMRFGGVEGAAPCSGAPLSKAMRRPFEG
jgi:hypothetical protein